MNKSGINIYFFLTKLGSEGVVRRRGRHPTEEVIIFSHITVQMLDGSILHGYLHENGDILPPDWILSPRILASRDVINPFRAYVRKSDGTGFSTILHERDVLSHSHPQRPHMPVSSVIQFRNGACSRAVLSLFHNHNNSRIQFNNSGTSVFVGFPEGLVFTGMFQDVDTRINANNSPLL